MMLCVLSVSAVQGEDVLVGTFDIDATTPVGSPLAYDIAVGVQTPLSCRGVVIVPGDRSPIVLCALDWIGISNGGQDAFRDQIAKAVGTDPERVVSCIHSINMTHPAVTFRPTRCCNSRPLAMRRSIPATPETL